MDKNTIRITRILGMTARGRFHIIEKGRRPFCRGTAEIVRLVHFPNADPAGICKHCVDAYQEHQLECVYLEFKGILELLPPMPY